MPSILVTHPAHFIRGPDGRVYAPESVNANAFWSRYLAVFDRVLVAARTRQVDAVPEDARRADGKGIEYGVELDHGSETDQTDGATALADWVERRYAELISGMRTLHRSA